MTFQTILVIIIAGQPQFGLEFKSAAECERAMTYLPLIAAERGDTLEAAFCIETPAPSSSPRPKPRPESV